MKILQATISPHLESTFRTGCCQGCLGILAATESGSESRRFDTSVFSIRLGLRKAPQAISMKCRVVPSTRCIGQRLFCEWVSEFHCNPNGQQMQSSQIKYTLALLSKIRDELERRFFWNTLQPIRMDRFTLVVHETPSLAIPLFACTDFTATMSEQSTTSMTWGNKSVSLLGLDNRPRTMSTSFSQSVNLHQKMAPKANHQRA